MDWFLVTCGSAALYAIGRWYRSHLTGRRQSKAKGQHRLGIPLKAVVANCEAKWFLQELQQAMQGDESAMVRVSHMLLVGYGTRQDEAAAAKWMRKAWEIQNFKGPADSYLRYDMLDLQNSDIPQLNNHQSPAAADAQQHSQDVNAASPAEDATSAGSQTDREACLLTPRQQQQTTQLTTPPPQQQQQQCVKFQERSQGTSWISDSSHGSSGSSGSAQCVVNSPPTRITRSSVSNAAAICSFRSCLPDCSIALQQTLHETDQQQQEQPVRAAQHSNQSCASLYLQQETQTAAAGAVMGTASQEQSPLLVDYSSKQSSPDCHYQQQQQQQQHVQALLLAQQQSFRAPDSCLPPLEGNTEQTLPGTEGLHEMSLQL